jgi:hypothetical protein
MTFLAPLLLWGLPIASLPVIVHLINLRRHRRVEWGAMMFLLQATRQRRGHTRLRHLLILTARVLAVAALIFVISRPMAGRWFGWLGGRPETVIVVLDRSASMAQQDLQSSQSKRSLAVQQIASAIEQTGAPRQLVLIESSGRPPQRLEGPESLIESPETGATDAASNLPAMLQQSLDYIVANKSGRTDIWVCSDLQATDWSPDSGQWAALRSGFGELKQPVRFHLLTYPERPEQNLSVRILELQRRRGGDADQLVMDVEIRGEQFAPAARVPLAIIIDGARSVVDVELSGDVIRLVDHVVPLDRQRTAGWGKVELPNDANPRDNVFFFTYGDSIQHRAVVVSDEPGSAWALRLAAAPPGQSTAESQVVASSELDTLAWDRTSLLLWQAPLPSESDRGRLQAFIRAGGTVVFFPPQADDETSRRPAGALPSRDADAESFLGVRWGDWRKRSTDGKQAIEQWRDDSGLLAHGDAGQPLPVNRLEVNEYRHIQGAAQTLARLKGGDPLLVHVPTDRGGVYFCATLPQEPCSNLAREGIVFFVMVQRAMREGSQRLLATQFGEIGSTDPPAVEEPWRRVEGWQEGSLSTEQRHVAGIYQAGELLRARNRPANEDTTGTLGDDQLDRLLTGLNYRIVRDSLQQGRSLVAEIWRVFAGLLLVALIAEAALCLPDVRPKKLVIA